MQNETIMGIRDFSETNLSMICLYQEVKPNQQEHKVYPQEECYEYMIGYRES